MTQSPTSPQASAPVGTHRRGRAAGRGRQGTGGVPVRYNGLGVAPRCCRATVGTGPPAID